MIPPGQRPRRSLPKWAVKELARKPGKAFCFSCKFVVNPVNHVERCGVPFLKDHSTFGSVHRRFIHRRCHGRVFNPGLYHSLKCDKCLREFPKTSRSPTATTIRSDELSSLSMIDLLEEEHQEDVEFSKSFACICRHCNYQDVYDEFKRRWVCGCDKLAREREFFRAYALLFRAGQPTGFLARYLERRRPEFAGSSIVSDSFQSDYVTKADSVSDDVLYSGSVYSGPETSSYDSSFLLQTRHDIAASLRAESEIVVKIPEIDWRLPEICEDSCEVSGPIVSTAPIIAPFTGEIVINLTHDSHGPEIFGVDEWLETGGFCEDEPVSVDDEELEIILNNPAANVLPTPKPKKGKHRSGRRTIANAPGFCYLKFVKKSMRHAAADDLGKRPSIGAVSDMFKRNKLTPRGHKVVFIGRGSHVVRHPGWKAGLQWSIISRCDRARAIGAEDWNDNHEETFADLFVNNDLQYWFEKTLEQPPPPKVEVDIVVGGEGTCWAEFFQHIPYPEGIHQYDGSFRHCTVGKFIDGLKAGMLAQPTSEYAKLKGLGNLAQRLAMYGRMERTEEGDWHLSDALCKWKKNLPKDPAELEALIDGRKSWQEIIVMLKRSGFVRTDDSKHVGVATASSVDKSLMNFTSPEVRLASEKLLQNAAKDSITAVYKLCPYKIPKKNQHKMEELAIPWSEHFSADHPHPIHAAIRRWTYMVALPKYIKCDCTFLGMKSEHFDMVVTAVEQMHGKGKYVLKLVNPIVDVKDIGRYAGKGDVPSETFELPSIDTPMLFCDESGHYLSPDWMIRVKIKNPGLRCIGMSNIFPLLSLEFEQSPEPEYVNWRIVKKRDGSTPTLIYVPEEDSGGKYEQPYDPTMTLLKRCSDEKGEVVWNGGVVEKKGNLRLQMFYSYHIETPCFITETEYAMMKLPRVFRSQPDSPPVQVKQFISMYQYAMTLPSSDPKNQWGKLRLFMQEEKIYFPASAQEWLIKVVMECAKIVVACNLPPKSYDNLRDEIFYKTIGHLHRKWVSLVNVRYSKRNAALVDHPDPFKIWPTLAVKVRNSADGALYGVNWKLDHEPEMSFWSHFKLWLTSVGRKANLVDSELRVSYDTDGSLIFPFIHNSWYFQKCYGYRFIREVQAKDYQKVFEGVTPSRKMFAPQPHRVLGHQPWTFVDSSGNPPLIVEDSEGEAEPEIDLREVVQVFRPPPSLPPRPWTPGIPPPLPERVPDLESDLGSEEGMSDGQSVRSSMFYASTTSSTSEYEPSVVERIMSEISQGEGYVPDDAVLPPNPFRNPFRPEAISDLPAFPRSWDSLAETSSIGDLSILERRPAELSAEQIPHEPMVGYRTTMNEFVADGGTPTREAYADFASREESIIVEERVPDLPVGNGPHGPALINFLKGVTQRRQNTTGSGWSARRPFVNTSAVFNDGGPFKREIERFRQAEKDRFERLMSSDYITGPGAAFESTRAWEKRCEEWLKMEAVKPSMGSQATQAVGKTLWDLMYPMTVSKRHNIIPYRDVVEYPSREYPRNDCLLVALGKGVGQSPAEIYFRMLRAFPRSELMASDGLSLMCIDPVALSYGVEVKVEDERGNTIGCYGVNDSKYNVLLRFEKDHVIFVKGKMPLVIQSPIPYTPGKGGELIERLSTWSALKWYDWIPEQDRADAYLRALMARTTGLLGEEINQAKLNGWGQMIDGFTPTSKKKFAVVMGDPGCRKSSRPQKLMNDPRYKKLGCFTAILPTSTLAIDWRDKLDASKKDKFGQAMPGEMVVTFEQALARYRSADLVITDEDKFPKGYHALFHILNPSASHHLFLCDPWQTQWHEPNSDCALNDTDMMGESEYYRKYSSMYMIGTYRLPAYLANFWRMPTWQKGQGAWAFTETVPNSWADLQQYFPWLKSPDLLQMWNARREIVPAHPDTLWADALRPNAGNNTMAGTQGLSTNFTVIHIDERVLKGSDPRLLYTAMTRQRYILFVKKWPDVSRNQVNEVAHPILGALRWYRQNYKLGSRTVIHPEHTVSIRDITIPFPDSIELVLAGRPDKVVNKEFLDKYGLIDPRIWLNWIDPDSKRAGGMLTRTDPAYVDRPDFQPFILEHEEFEPEDSSPVEVVLPDSLPGIHLPIESRIAFTEKFNQRPERFAAELTMKGAYSEQLGDLPQLRKDSVAMMKRLFEQTPGVNRRARWDVVNRLVKTPPDKNPFYYTTEIMNWGLDQKASDQISFLAAVKQRLRYTSVQENLNQMAYQKTFGVNCFNALKRYLKWENPVVFDEELYHRCEVAFQVRRGERSQAMKKGSLNRADPDFGILLTAKTQWKLKDRDFSKAKPLQPVMIHADKYLFEYGPKGIYLLEKILEHCPDWWFLYAKKTPDDFENWTKRSFEKGELFEMNDLKGQDQSTQGWAVELFSLVMEHFGFKQEWIDNFKMEKMTKMIKDKVLSIMTNSGEIWTYLLNTVSAAARECFMFSLPPGLAMASGGDDTLRKKYGGVNPGYVELQALDPCEDKRFESTRGEFCSFMIKNGTLTKDPIILTKRFLGRLSRGEGETAVLGYSYLWAFNYRKAEMLSSIFDEDEMTAHQIMTRVMFNLKKEKVYTKPDWSILRINGDPHDDTAQTVFSDLSTASATAVFEDTKPRTDFTSAAEAFYTSHYDAFVALTA